MVRRAGDTFILTIGDRHLWVAITVPAGAGGAFIAVNMTSVKNGKPLDGTCIVRPGEHPFISVETDMYYMKAREWQVTGFDSLASYGAACQAHKPVSAALCGGYRTGLFSLPS